ncbi:hypothetical protein ACSSV8_003334 [Roseovarius sp. MBR-79]|jgi:hypothetical protein
MAKQARYDQGYDLRQDGERRVISFGGDGIPWSGYVFMGIMVLPALSLLLTPFWIVPTIGIPGLVFLVYLTFQRQEFTLTPLSIIKGANEYDLARVTEVLIDNPMDKEVSISGGAGLIIGGTGVAGASMAAMGAIANATTGAMMAAAVANARAAAKRRFRVRIRYGSTVVTLARNLKRDRAVAIFQLLTSA